LGWLGVAGDERIGGSGGCLSFVSVRVYMKMQRGE
jgi:hypothetical protein